MSRPCKISYRRGAELPTLTLPWEEEIAQNEWDDLDLSSGYTFTLTLTDSLGAVQLTKVTGITGGDGFVVVAWAVDDLEIPVGPYSLRLRARETSTGKDRDYEPGRPIRIQITP